MTESSRGQLGRRIALVCSIPFRFELADVCLCPILVMDFELGPCFERLAAVEKRRFFWMNTATSRQSIEWRLRGQQTALTNVQPSFFRSTERSPERAAAFVVNAISWSGGKQSLYVVRPGESLEQKLVVFGLDAVPGRFEGTIQKDGEREKGERVREKEKGERAWKRERRWERSMRKPERGRFPTISETTIDRPLSTRKRRLPSQKLPFLDRRRLRLPETLQQAFRAREPTFHQGIFLSPPRRFYAIPSPCV